MTNFNDKTLGTGSANYPAAVGHAGTFAPGQVVGGKYKILSIAGKGGMGTVYRVHQVFLNKELALKVLDNREISDESQMRRFQVEAKAAYSLNHPNLVKVHDFGLLENDQPYLVMDLVDGVTLAEFVKEHGPLPVDTAAIIFAQTCLGLAYAHKQSVIHRDIKPSNIMLVSAMQPGTPGSVKILDFGIAKIATDEKGEIQALTRTGEIFGSPFYMSPEQCSGDRIDQRTDVYSLGCALFESLTGTPPHVGTNALRTMMLHQSEAPPMLAEASMGNKFPDAMEEIVERMLRKAPHERYQDLDAVAADLLKACSSKVTAQSPVMARSIDSTGRVKSVPNKKSGLISMTVPKFVGVIVSTIILTATATGLVANWYFSSRKPEVATAPDQPQKIALAEQDIKLLVAPDMKEVDARAAKGIAERKANRLKLENAEPITFRTVDSNGSKIRVVQFPSVQIGVVECRMNPTSDPISITKAVDTQRFPLAGALTLKVGDLYLDAFDTPSVFKEQGSDGFIGLEICRPLVTPIALSSIDRDTEFAPESVKSNATKIILNAVNWKNLSQLTLEGIPVDRNTLKAVEQLPHLLSFVILKGDKTEDLLAKGSFIKKLNTLNLFKCSTSKIIDAISGSQNMQRLIVEQCDVTPRLFKTLASCTNLEYLQLRLEQFSNEMAEDIAKVRSLKLLTLRDTPITPRQLQILLKENPQLQIQLSGKATNSILYGFSEPRVRVIRDPALHEHNAAVHLLRALDR